MPSRHLSVHLALNIVEPEGAGDSMAREHSIAWGRFRLDMARRLWPGEAGQYQAYPRWGDAATFGLRIQVPR